MDNPTSEMFTTKRTQAYSIKPKRVLRYKNIVMSKLLHFTHI